MAMLGQYEGPGGTAALAVVAPVWNIIYSPGLLTGIGGSVIFSTKKALRAAGMIKMHILRQPLWVLFCLRLLPGAGLLLPFNIFSAYYFQSILKTKAAFIISVGRGLVISGAFILLLPLCFGGSSVLASHAADGACNGALRCRADEKVYRGGINRIPAPLA